FASIVFYNKAVNAADLTTAERSLNQAINLSNSDIYWKTRTALYINQFTDLAKKEDPDKTQLQTLFTQAEQSAQQTIALDRENSASWLALSQVYQLIADGTSIEALTNATTAAAEAQKRNPNNPLLRLNNARIEIIKKDMTAALASIEEALILKPNYLDAFILKGQIEQSQGDSQAIKNQILKYVVVAPYDDQGYILLGNSYIALKDYQSALEAFIRARQLNPSNANTYLAYIGTLELLGNRTKAVEELEIFKKQFPTVTGVDEQIKRIQDGTAPASTP
ncbi:MAG: tetratricopeptide repeat protein, partial [Patescibacteria group bacterium]